MLPEYARKFEKYADGSETLTWLWVEAARGARMLDGRPLISREELNRAIDQHIAPLCGGDRNRALAALATMGAWWGAGRHAFAVDDDLWTELGRSDPAPGAFLPPLDSGAVYAGGQCMVFARLGYGAPPDALLIVFWEARGLWIENTICGVWSIPIGKERPRSTWPDKLAPVDPLLVALHNLFALMADRGVSQTPVNGGHEKPVKPGERVKAARRPFTRLSLTEPMRRRSAPATPTGRHLSAHIRRGHWKRYWVRDPNGRTVLSKKDGKHGDLHEVRQWVRPCRVGEGDPARRQYEVTL